MYPVSVLEGIQDPKLRSFLETSYLKIHAKVGVLFDIAIKDIVVNVDIYNLDELVYNEVFIDYAIIPKTNVVFVSKFTDIKYLDLPLNTTVVRVPPPKRSVYNLTRYSLHRLMCPTFHDLNINTVINKVSVTVTVKLYSDTVTETPFGGVVGLPVLLNNSA